MESEATRRTVEGYLAIFQEVRRLHQEAFGRDIEMYKHTEPDCLEGVFETLWASEKSGIEFVAEVLHGLVWGQCLGNGNHRTAILFLRTFLEVEGVRLPEYHADQDADARFQADLDRWIIPSQVLIRNRGDPRKNQKYLEPDHREKTTRWLYRMLENQSDALMMIGPQRLMDFRV